MNCDTFVFISSAMSVAESNMKVSRPDAWCRNKTQPWVTTVYGRSRRLAAISICNCIAADIYRGRHRVDVTVIHAKLPVQWQCRQKWSSLTGQNYFIGRYLRIRQEALRNLSRGNLRWKVKPYLVLFGTFSNRPPCWITNARDNRARCL